MATPNKTHLQAAVVVIGVGGIGTAVARRLASGKVLVLGDNSAENLQTCSSILKREGHEVRFRQVDVSQKDSVELFAKFAADCGRLESVVHAAGLTPIAGSASKIYNVNLVGTVNVIDVFETYASPGMSMVCIASLAGHFDKLETEVEAELATLPADEILKRPYINVETDDPTRAYSTSKRANILRVQAAATRYGDRGARINTVSPGTISTENSLRELEGPGGDLFRHWISASPARRFGTGQDVAEMVAFLTGPGATYVTGSDFLVDGGVLAMERWAGDSRRMAEVWK